MGSMKQIFNSLLLRELFKGMAVTGRYMFARKITVQFPEEMIWLWRDYDPSKTEQDFQMEPAEAAKPVFRVSVTNRDAE